SQEAHICGEVMATPPGLSSKNRSEIMHDLAVPPRCAGHRKQLPVEILASKLRRALDLEVLLRCQKRNRLGRHIALDNSLTRFPHIPPTPPHLTKSDIDMRPE